MGYLVFPRRCQKQGVTLPMAATRKQLLMGWVLGALAGCSPAASSPPSVVLVSLDTLRADRLGAYGSTLDLTPNLDRFADEAMVFRHAYSSANETLYSHASLFTGLEPSEVAPLGPEFYIPEEIPVLAQVLQSYGYATGAFVAGGHLDPQFGLTRGFDTWQSSPPWGSLFHTFPLALRWLDGLKPDQPWFAFIHGYDTHARYLKPPPFGYLDGELTAGPPGQWVVQDPVGTLRLADGRFHATVEEVVAVAEAHLHPRGPEARGALLAQAEAASSPTLSAADLQQVVAAYSGAVRYADALFGLMMAALERRGVLEKAYVVVLSDHGEALGEDGMFDHRYGLSDAEVAVPLMIRAPGGRGSGRVCDQVVSLTRVLPTVLEWAGAKPPAEVTASSLGKLLRGEEDPAPGEAFSQGALRLSSLRTAEGRLTYTGIRPGSPYLALMVGRASLAGPGFTLSPGLSPAHAEKMRSRLEAWSRELRPPRETPGLSLDPALQERLRAKGYWEGPR